MMACFLFVSLEKEVLMMKGIVVTEMDVFISASTSL